MKIQTLKCPECMATLDIEEGREYCFCQYCGYKIIVQDENKHTFRHINDAEVKRAEAEMKRAETEQIIQLKEIALEERNNEIKRVLLIVWIVATAILGIAGLLGAEVCLLFAMVVGIWGAYGFLKDLSDTKKRRSMTPNDVMLTGAMVDYTDKNYKNHMAIFQSAGFRNISEIPLHDLNIFTSKKNGIIQDVTINGKGLKKGDIVDKDAIVTITYHSFRK